MIAAGFDADIPAGAAEDTLQAYWARIPQIGQLMIAEQSCWRDGSDRKRVKAVPGARRIPAEHGSVVRSGSIG
jgi:hypothetical protein